MSPFRAVAFLGLVLLATLPAAQAAAPVPVILDTDIGNDIDDALALAMLHSLQSRGEVRLLAVTITKDNRYAAPFVDLVNTFYGRPDIPIGVVRRGKTPSDAPMLRVPAEMRGPTGVALFPHRLTSGEQAPEAVALLTRILKNQPNSSVVLIQIGFSTNLARLLQTPGGKELVAKKVKLLSIMGGNFKSAEPEYNIDTDPESAAALLRDWPGPVLLSGFEVGLAITFPYASYETGFTYTAHHPIAESAKAFFPKAEDRPAWDPTAVLQAIRPDASYFALSAPGRVTLGPKAITVFSAAPQGNCRYLLLKPEKVAEIRRVLVDLVTQPATVHATQVARQQATERIAEPPSNVLRR